MSIHLFLKKTLPMSKPNIYFAKSNACDPDDVMKVRKALSFYDCNIIEFRGGVYDSSQMTECDMIILLPHSKQFSAPKKPENSFKVGRGQWYQISDFKDKAGIWDNRESDDNIFMISLVGEKFIYLDEITDMTRIEENTVTDKTIWALNYGLTFTNQAMINLNNYGVNSKDIAYQVDESTDSISDKPTPKAINSKSKHNLLLAAANFVKK